MAVGGAVGADVVVWFVLVAGRAGGGGGVQVERPQPEARTNDLDAGGGRRTLGGEDDQLSCGPAGAGVRIVSLGVEVAEVGRLGCRGISSFRCGRMMRSRPRPRRGSIS